MCVVKRFGKLPLRERKTGACGFFFQIIYFSTTHNYTSRVEEILNLFSRMVWSRGCLVKEFGLGGLLCKFFNSILAGPCLLLCPQAPRRKRVREYKRGWVYNIKVHLCNSFILFQYKRGIFSIIKRHTWRRH